MTFSIVACDKNAHRVGIAITTSSIAVGSRCPWVRAGVGAVATQNITDPSLGNAILDAIGEGKTPAAAIDELAQSKQYIQYRQIVAIDAAGNIGHLTGSLTLGTHAVAVGDCCAAGGNLLANTDVPSAMVRAFESRSKNQHLAESLLGALEAGIAAGGEQGDVHSAALLVASRYSWPEVDLRVDWHDADAVGALRKLWEDFNPQMRDYLLRALSPEDAPSYGVPGDL